MGAAGSGNFLPMGTRNFRIKTCAVCGRHFRPRYPRSKRCHDCQAVFCEICGADISKSASLARIKRGQGRRCHKCDILPDGTRREDRSIGYMRIKIAGKWRFEHRAVMEKIIGRPLRQEEVVHHRDKNGMNNAPDNLQLFPNMRAHLDEAHADDLVNPPVHHNGRKPKTNSERREKAAKGSE